MSGSPIVWNTGRTAFATLKILRYTFYISYFQEVGILAKT